MLIVSIILPTTDTVTDVKLGIVLTTGRYDQPWECCTKLVTVWMYNDTKSCYYRHGTKFPLTVYDHFKNSSMIDNCDNSKTTSYPLCYNNASSDYYYDTYDTYGANDTNGLYDTYDSYGNYYNNDTYDSLGTYDQCCACEMFQKVPSPLCNYYASKPHLDFGNINPSNTGK